MSTLLLRLAGVKTDGEMRSFIFDSRKGLEPILFDYSDQNTLLNVVNRVKQIRYFMTLFLDCVPAYRYNSINISGLL